MEINLTNYKTEEELEKFLESLKSNTAMMKGIIWHYGSFEDFKKQTMDKWKEIYSVGENNNINEKHFNSLKELEDYVELSLKKREEKVSKKCRVINGKFKGLEGNVRDNCELLNKYLIQLTDDEFNAIYVDKKDVEIIEERKDIIINGVDKESGEYGIVISKSNIVVNSEVNGKHELLLTKNTQEKIINNIKNNKDVIVKYILIINRNKKIENEWEEICKDINKLESTRSKLYKKYKENENYTYSLLESLEE